MGKRSAMSARVDYGFAELLRQAWLDAWHLQSDCEHRRTSRRCVFCVPDIATLNAKRIDDDGATRAAVAWLKATRGDSEV